MVGNLFDHTKGPALIDSGSLLCRPGNGIFIMTMLAVSQVIFVCLPGSFPFQSGWKERNRLYQLYHYLNHYLLFGGGYGQKSVDIAKQFI
jgi:fructosamine-3-kinase